MSMKSIAHIVGDKAEKKGTADKKKMAKEIMAKELVVFRLVTNFTENKIMVCFFFYFQN